MSERLLNNASTLSWNKYAVRSTVLTLLAFAPSVILLSVGHTLLALLYLAIPLVLFSVSFPRYSFYLLVAVNFVYAPYYITGFAIHLWDVAAFIFIGAVAISWLFRYKPGIDKTTFDYSLWALIFATVISVIFAYKPVLSIVPTTRIILIYFAYRAFYHLSGKYRPFRMIRYFIYVFTGFSLYNAISFLRLGAASRLFGLSGIAFETFCMVGVPVTLAYAIWSQSRRERTIYSIFLMINLLAAVATMSRGPLITIVVACPVLLIASFIKAGKLGSRSARNYVKGFTVVAVVVLLITIAGTGLFFALGERFEELFAEQPTGTILLRFSLWKAAIESFQLRPITGIGIGNFRIIDDLLPHLKFDPVRYYLVGMSFHNVFLQYLSETGIIGALALLFLAWKAFSTGVRTLNYVDRKDDMAVAAAGFMCSFIFFITIFYMRVWIWGQEGYMLAFILALVARHYRTLKKGDNVG